MDKIYFKKDYKYQLQSPYSIYTGILGYTVELNFLILQSDGLLIIRRGFAWDGPSKIPFFLKKFMRATLVHDALYELIRKGCISKTEKKQADALFLRILNEDQTGHIAIRICKFFVYHFGKFFIKETAERKLIEAP